MRVQQLNKLYSKLTPHEQATLVFEAAIREDKKEADLVLGCVENRTYDAPHADYQRRIQGLCFLSGVYGLVYWKTLCQLGLSIALSIEDNLYAEISKRYIRKIVSINVALETVCKELKVDVFAIKQFAECSDYDPDFVAEVDGQIVDQYIDIFQKQFFKL